MSASGPGGGGGAVCLGVSASGPGGCLPLVPGGVCLWSQGVSASGPGGRLSAPGNVSALGERGCLAPG